MAKKKKQKIKHRPVPVGELVRQAEEEVHRGQPDKAIQLLARAEAEIRHSAKSGPLPAHLATIQPAVAQLMARAYFARAIASEDLNRKIADLDKAIKRAPSEPRFIIAAGACNLLAGDAKPAFEMFQRARELRPDDPLVERAFVLGLIASGRTREAKERARQAPEEKLDAHLERLVCLREIAVGNFAQAIERAEKVRAKDSSAIASSLLKGLALLASGDSRQAGRQLDEIPALDRNPSQSEATALATQLYYSGALNFRSGRVKEAAAGFEEVERVARAHALRLPWMESLAAYYHKIAESSALEGNLQQAVEFWRRARQLEPNDKVVVQNIEAALRVEANRSWRDGDLNKAIELWEECLQSKPQDETLLKSLAVAYEKADRKEEAVTYWRQLARAWRQKAKSEKPGAQFLKMLLRLEEHIVNGMMEADRPHHEILSEMDAALKIDPTSLELRHKYADLYMEMGKPQQALKHLEYIERRQGESVEMLVQKGMALDMTRKNAAAKKCFERAFELEPSNQLARLTYLVKLGNEAMEADKSGDIDLAIEICQKQLSIESKYMPALGHLFSLYLSDDMGEEADEVKARILDDAPSDPQRRVMLGSMYLENDYEREAEEEFKRAIEIEASDECFFNIGIKYLDNEDHKKAIKYFKRVSKTAPVPMLVDIAQSLTDHSEFREAQRFVDMAIEKDPKDPVPHMVKGVILSTKGEIAAGDREFAEAERLAVGRSGFDDLLKAIRSARRHFEEMREFEEIAKQLDSGDIDLDSMPPKMRQMLIRMIGRS